MKIGYKRGYPKTLEFCCEGFYKEIYMLNPDIIGYIHDCSGGELKHLEYLVGKGCWAAIRFCPFCGEEITGVKLDPYGE